MPRKYTTVRAKTCSEPTCVRIANGSGKCDLHAEKYQPGVDFLESIVGTEKIECIEWPFAKSKGGYGVLRARHFNSAYAAVCEMAHGPRPSSNHDAAHLCGNRACVNPNHIRWVTKSENMRHMIPHGTNGRKLSLVDVLAIRDACKTMSNTAVAKQFGITVSYVGRLKSEKSWRDIRGALASVDLGS